VKRITGIYTLIKKYGLIGFCELSIDYLKMKLIYGKWKPRIIRSGCRIRGANYINIGNNFSAGYRLRIDAFGKDAAQIEIGENVRLGDDVHIASIKKVIIEKDTLMASKIYISDHNHGIYSGMIQSNPFEWINNRPLTQKDVRIGQNVWIGELVSILPGVTIGNNSIIGANSVVVKDIPDNSIAVGVPAKVVKIWSQKNNKWIKCN
jgi:lipopolysaccharide O-acetyltransferase